VGLQQLAPFHVVKLGNISQPWPSDRTALLAATRGVAEHWCCAVGNVRLDPHF